MNTRTNLVLALVGCTADPLPPPIPTTPTSQTQGLVFDDLGLDAGVQGWIDGHFQRGRACAPADFDGDGDLDLYVGNPMDLSHVWLNDTVPGDHLHFALGQVVFDTVQAWGASGADVDGDGDPDLHVQGGGNEYPAPNFFLRNAGGTLVDETEASGLVIPLEDGTRFLDQSAGGQWADFDRDGRLDLFVSETAESLDLVDVDPTDHVAHNQLWLGQADGTWVDGADAAGLRTRLGTRVSAFLDFDRDGWLDLFENNEEGRNVLWHAGGDGTFVNQTQRRSLADSNLAWPMAGSWASIALDANSDGWDDLLVLRRGLPFAGEPEAHSNGHLLFLNVEGSFVEVADYTHLNDNFLVFNHFTNGVMGCQAADLNADGYPDIVTGNGSPESGAVNGLFLTKGLLEVEVPGVGPLWLPQYADLTALTDDAAPEEVLLHAPGPGPAPGEYPTYPYRTHGLCAADYDGDGFLELFEANGGPGDTEPELLSAMREPDRLWKVTFDDPTPHWVGLTLVGGGIVPRDAIGARVAVAVGHEDEVRTLHQTRFSGSGFAASNGPELFFGLGLDDRVDDVVVTWPDGSVERFPPPDVDSHAILEIGGGVPIDQ
jgi:hypothetical protein